MRLRPEAPVARIFDREQVAALRRQGLSPRQIAKRTGLGLGTGHPDAPEAYLKTEVAEWSRPLALRRKTFTL